MLKGLEIAHPPPLIPSFSNSPLQSSEADAQKDCLLRRVDYFVSFDHQRGHLILQDKL